MSTDLDHAIKSAVSDIIAATPDVTGDPTAATFTPTSGAAQRRLLPAAAAVLLVAAAVTGIALAGRGSPSQTAPGAAEQPVGPAQTDLEPEPTAPATLADPDQPCSDGTAETSVPNVAGMPYQAAIDTLNAAGLSIEVSPEMSPDGEPATYGYVVAKQHTTPGDTLACGNVVVLTVADRPTATYRVEPGDTWESIAAAQNIIVEDLLDANGETVASPLAPGRAITLIFTEEPIEATTPQTASRFVVEEQDDGLIVADIIDRDGGVVTIELAASQFPGTDLKFNIIPGQYAEPPAEYDPAPVEIRGFTGVSVTPADNTRSLLWQEEDELAIELSATVDGDQAALPTTADLIDLATRLVQVDETTWTAYREQHP